LARKYGQRPGPAGELAAAWALLPKARQDAILAEIRAALGQLTDSVHPKTRDRHVHNHPAPDGTWHSHEHEHRDDAVHRRHDHAVDPAVPVNAQGARPGQAYKRHMRFSRGQVQILNAAQAARVDAAWNKLTADMQAIDQQRRGQR
jgi:hypothetical protein